MGAFTAPAPGGVWHETAALVVEVASPGDESWQKLPFSAAHGVDEVLIVDPAARDVHWLALEAETDTPVDRSRLIEVSRDQLVASIDWPSAPE